jgi:hypothetical protein
MMLVIRHHKVFTPLLIFHSKYGRRWLLEDRNSCLRILHRLNCHAKPSHNAGRNAANSHNLRDDDEVDLTSDQTIPR